MEVSCSIQGGALTRDAPLFVALPTSFARARGGVPSGGAAKRELRSVAAQYEYDAFGNLRPENSFDHFGNRFRFQGREWDAHAGHYHYRFRDYIPEWGSFSGPDMNLELGPEGEPNGMGSYLFCNNDPLSFADPLGLESSWIPRNMGQGVIWGSRFGSSRELVGDIRTDFIETPLSLCAETVANGSDILGPPLHGLGMTIGLHVWEGVYSHLRTMKRVYDTGPVLELINPGSKRFVLWEILNGCMDTVRVAGGFPVSLLSGDFLDTQPPMTFDVVKPVVSFNGIFNNSMSADIFAEDVRMCLGVSDSTHIKNRTTYVGDFVQILGNELGFVDITAIRGARALRAAGKQGRSIDVVAHSQGTMTFFSALALVDTSNIRSLVKYQGCGSQMFISAPYLGLCSAENNWNRSASRYDKVPISNYLPTPIKLFGFHTFLPGYGGWQIIDSSMNGTLRGQEGNMHSFFYYSPYVR